MLRSSLLLSALLLGFGLASADTLRGAFDAAGPGGGFDKLVILEPGRVYTGGLLIGSVLVPETATFVGGEEFDVRIEGRGAVIDLQGGQICLSYVDRRLEIEDCVIVGGNVRFRGVDWEPGRMPKGLVRNVTFYAPHDYALRFQGCGDDIVAERNLFVDARDTGPDFAHTNGYPFDLIFTGLNVGLSVLGMPSLSENWSYHSQTEINADPLHHFGFL